jgi:hypothetical protein
MVEQKDLLRLGIELEFPFAPKFEDRLEIAKKVNAEDRVYSLPTLRTACREHIKHFMTRKARLIFHDAEPDGFNCEFIFKDVDYITLYRHYNVFTKMFKIMLDLGYYANPRLLSAGLHISIDRSVLFISEFEKLVNTFIVYNRIFTEISGRKGRSTDLVALRPLVLDAIGNKDQTFIDTVSNMRKGMLVNAFKNGVNMHSLGIRLHPNRIEFTWFSSTLRNVELFARLEFIVLLVQYCKSDHSDFGVFINAYKSQTTFIKLMQFRI